MKDLGKKKLLMIFAGIIVLAILIIIILLVYNAFFGRYSYEDIENKVLVAAQDYYTDHKDLLPKNANEKVTTTDVSLAEAGYLDSMAELTKKMDGVSCSATVTVSYANGEYLYTPILDCGDSYKTVTLYSHIKQNEKIVTSGQGLYNLNKQLVYRGEEPNNYVMFSGKQWRIVKLTNNKIVLILNEKLVRDVWDDRFNADRNSIDGINNYTVSRIKDTLMDIYNGETLFTASDRKLLTAHTLYIGSRGINDTTNNGSIEKKKLLKNQYIGLLPLYDYFNASIDKNCKSATTDSCINYNYLTEFNYNWWTSTTDKSTSHKVFRISSDGTVDLIRASSNSYIRPVVYLTGDAIYASGDGSLENPYKIK